MWAHLAGAIEALAIPELRSFEAKEVLRDPKSSSSRAEHFSLLAARVFQSHERTFRREVQRVARR